MRPIIMAKVLSLNILRFNPKVQVRRQALNHLWKIVGRLEKLCNFGHDMMKSVSHYVLKIFPRLCTKDAQTISINRQGNNHWSLKTIFKKCTKKGPKNHGKNA